MPILRRLKALDWTALLAELVLIFIGITAALWFDNANQDRADTSGVLRPFYTRFREWIEDGPLRQVRASPRHPPHV